ncbi:uncharacterized protein LOC134476503 [Cavia porcellus]|uniref:uncharacterized protein LOC134476503 n=1 Tax=Cavia porcellus TaxID=10141 RepID=UPI002FE2C6D0
MVIAIHNSSNIHSSLSGTLSASGEPHPMAEPILPAHLLRPLPRGPGLHSRRNRLNRELDCGRNAVRKPLMSRCRLLQQSVPFARSRSQRPALALGTWIPQPPGGAETGEGARTPETLAHLLPTSFSAPPTLGVKSAALGFPAAGGGATRHWPRPGPAPARPLRLMAAAAGSAARRGPGQPQAAAGTRSPHPSPDAADTPRGSSFAPGALSAGSAEESQREHTPSRLRTSS